MSKRASVSAFISEGNKTGTGIRARFYGGYARAGSLAEFCVRTEPTPVFFIGWDAHRKVAQDWYENKIPWELMPERSHKFLYKGPTGVYGPSKLNVQPSTRGRDDEDEEESMSA
jgi:hypothetical protein